MFELVKQIGSTLLRFSFIAVGWIPEIVIEGRKTGMRKTSYVVILLMLALPAVGVYGTITLAKADDLRALSNRLDDAILNFNTKTSKIQASVDALVKVSLSSQLRDLKRRLCVSTNPLDRSSINGEIDRVQDQYKDLTGGSYAIPPCSEL